MVCQVCGQRAVPRTGGTGRVQLSVGMIPFPNLEQTDWSVFHGNLVVLPFP